MGLLTKGTIPKGTTIFPLNQGNGQNALLFRRDFPQDFPILRARQEAKHRQQDAQHWEQRPWTVAWRERPIGNPHKHSCLKRKHDAKGIKITDFCWNHQFPEENMSRSFWNFMPGSRSRSWKRQEFWQQKGHHSLPYISAPAWRSLQQGSQWEWQKWWLSLCFLWYLNPATG